MIKVYVQNGFCFVYNIEDWETLRSKHRIIGEILGNNFCIPSLPLRLLPEEALLLKRKGIATLLNCPKLTASPSDDFRKAYDEFKEKLLEQLKIVYERIRKKQIENVIDKIICGKRKRGDTRCKEEIFDEEYKKSSIIDNDMMLWPIFCSHLNLVEDGLIEVMEDEILKTTTHVKLAIFMDLWDKGYFITPGNKFGGDFLLYLGDPILHHAVNIVHCTSESRSFHMSELVSLSRLGSSVKKRILLATLKDDGHVNYITLNWLNT